uniref:Gag protein n=1 Tax=Rhipicephalus appendiculatus TaxID=34631 RepID=A0A131Z5Q9_RHIAP
MLATILFYLKGRAKVWFHNHEEEIDSWEACKEQMRVLFRKSTGRKTAAKKELASRAQTSLDLYLSYIQDVLSLCRKADDGMEKSEKVAHILKGIDDGAFNLPICKDCDTADAIIRECQCFEAAKSRRIAHQFARLPNTAATWSCEDLPAPQEPLTAEHVTKIIQRELEAMSPASTCPRACESSSQMVPLVHAIVHRELSNVHRELSNLTANM